MRVLALVLGALATAQAFIAPAPARAVAPPRLSRVTVQMGFMDGLNKAFANEVIDTPSREGGLSAGAKQTIPVDICGRKIQAVKGQKLKDLIRASRAPGIVFNCEKGDCGSCESMVNGRKMRVCRAAVTGPVTIKALR